MEANVIPRYDIGFLGSVVPDYGMGLIIPFPQSLGIFPVLKHTLKGLCKTVIVVLFFKISYGRQSRPHALLLPAFKTAYIDIFTFSSDVSISTL